MLIVKELERLRLIYLGPDDLYYAVPLVDATAVMKQDLEKLIATTFRSHQLFGDQ